MAWGTVSLETATAGFFIALVGAEGLRELLAVSFQLVCADAQALCGLQLGDIEPQPHVPELIAQIRFPFFAIADFGFCLLGA